MSTGELTPDSLAAEPEILAESLAAQVQNDKEFRQAVHGVFLPRVSEVMRSRLGRYCIVPRETSDEPSDDITDPAMGFIEAVPERTPAALKNVSKAVLNISAKVAVMDDYIDRHNLMDADSITVITSHDKIFDILGACCLINLSKLRPDHSPVANNMVLTRGINYLDYRVPPPFKSRRGNVVEDVILPMTNVVPAYPPSATVETLKAEYPEQIKGANFRVSREMIEHGKLMKKLGHKVITFSSPPGKQMVKTDDAYFAANTGNPNFIVCKTGETVEPVTPGQGGKFEPGLIMQPISTDAKGAIEKAHKKRSVIVPVGLHFPVVPAFILAKIPGFPGLPLRLHLEEPLTTERKDREDIDTWVETSLMKVGSRSSQGPIYYVRS